MTVLSASRTTVYAYPSAHRAVSPVGPKIGRSSGNAAGELFGPEQASKVNIVIDGGFKTESGESRQTDQKRELTASVTAREVKPAGLDARQTSYLSQAKQAMEIQRIVSQLRSTDTRVRAHEAAHMGAGAGLITSGASFTFQKGPDGRNYAVGGEVGIDTSAVAGDAHATIAKMQQVRAAALAPANPSSQDISVAAAASALSAQALAEIAAADSEKSDKSEAAGNSVQSGKPDAAGNPQNVGTPEADGIQDSSKPRNEPQTANFRSTTGDS